MSHSVDHAGASIIWSMDPMLDLRHGWTAVALAVAGLVLAGCGDDLCTSESACPAGPSETPSQEQWRLTGNVSLKLLNPKLNNLTDMQLEVGDLDFFAGGSAETCDTATAEACSQINVVLSMRLPILEHEDPETGELSFVTKDPDITVFGTMSLDPAYPNESVYRAETLDVRTCSRLQSSPPEGPFRGQGHQVQWASQIEFQASREGQGATLSFTGMPLTLTSNAESCEPFELSLSGDFELER